MPSKLTHKLTSGWGSSEDKSSPVGCAAAVIGQCSVAEAATSCALPRGQCRVPFIVLARTTPAGAKSIGRGHPLHTTNMQALPQQPTICTSSVKRCGLAHTQANSGRNETRLRLAALSAQHAFPQVHVSEPPGARTGNPYSIGGVVRAPSWRLAALVTQTGGCPRAASKVRGQRAQVSLRWGGCTRTSARALRLHTHHARPVAAWGRMAHAEHAALPKLQATRAVQTWQHCDMVTPHHGSSPRMAARRRGAPWRSTCLLTLLLAAAAQPITAQVPSPTPGIEQVGWHIRWEAVCNCA
jgi:hypothetical protein